MNLKLNLLMEIKGASLLDWPITLQDMEPYYTRAEDAKWWKSSSSCK